MNKKFAVIIAVILIAAVAFSILLFIKNDTNDVTSVISRIEKHVVLPTNEEPAVLTITDKTKLGTEFLKQSQNGDRVLVYKNNRKAIIYRPSIDKIVDIGPVVIDTPQGAGNN